jgi:hypothetical protein
MYSPSNHAATLSGARFLAFDDGFHRSKRNRHHPKVRQIAHAVFWSAKLKTFGISRLVRLCRPRGFKMRCAKFAQFDLRNLVYSSKNPLILTGQIAHQLFVSAHLQFAERRKIIEKTTVAPTFLFARPFIETPTALVPAPLIL